MQREITVRLALRGILVELTAPRDVLDVQQLFIDAVPRQAEDLLRAESVVVGQNQANSLCLSLLCRLGVLLARRESCECSRPMIPSNSSGK